MKISTRGRYGLRLLLDLARCAGRSHAALASIAESEGISPRYLEQVAVILRRAGIIRSVKGAQGGYALARKPEEIVLGDVLRELEGDMLVTDPPIENEEESPLRRCVREALFDKINERIAAVIDRETLAGISNLLPTDDMYFI